MLLLKDVHTYYGESHILKGISSEIKEGELVTLLGRNGAGKTTTLRSIMGIVPPKQGTITFDGINICCQKPHIIASLGVGYVPEERMIFPSLTVFENLSLPAKGSKGGLWELEKIYQYFRVLGERADQKGSQLSGGEQQRVAIARALVKNPPILLCDEPTGELDFDTGKHILSAVRMINEVERKTVLLATHNTAIAEIAHRVIRLRSGGVVEIKTNQPPLDPMELRW